MSHTVLCNRGPFWVRLRVPALTPAAALAQAEAWAAAHVDRALVSGNHPPGLACRAVVELTRGGPVDVDLTAV
jgi:hypothetical protein